MTTRSRSVLVLAFAWSVQSPLAGQTSAGEVRGRALFERAQQAVESGDFVSALDNFERVIELMGPVPELLYNAAQAAWKVGDVDKAERYVYGALESGDERFASSPQHELAFRLAAQVEAAREAERNERTRLDHPRLIDRYLTPEEGVILFNNGDGINQVDFSCRGPRCTYTYLRTSSKRDDFGETIGLRVTLRFRPSDVVRVVPSSDANGFDVLLADGTGEITTHEWRDGYPFKTPSSGSISSLHLYVPIPSDGSYSELRGDVIALIEQLARAHKGIDQ